MALPVIGSKVPFGVGSLQLLVFRLELRLLDGQVENQNSRDHDKRNDEEERAVADMRQPVGFGGGVQHRRKPQIQDTAHGAHQIDDGIGAAAQRFGGDIGHQRHSGGTIGAHRHQQQAQHHDKDHQCGRAGVGGIAVVQQGNQVHQHGCSGRTAHDERHTAPDFGVGLVGQGTKERQQEQRQYIVRRHDGTGEGLVQFKGVGQDQGHNAVVHLPEGTDRQKRKAHQNGAAVVQLHGNSPYLRGDESAPYCHHCNTICMYCL